MQNVLKQNWRNYSQTNGKRRKITHIPVDGKINNNLRAMGTKRIPIPKQNFNFYYMSTVNFSNVEQNLPLDLSRYKKRKNLRIADLTQQEINSLTSEEFKLLKDKEDEEVAQDQYKQQIQQSRKSRATYRLGIETLREARNWSNTLGLLPL